MTGTKSIDYPDIVPPDLDPDVRPEDDAMDQPEGLYREMDPSECASDDDIVAMAEVHDDHDANLLPGRPTESGQSESGREV